MMIGCITCVVASMVVGQAGDGATRVAVVNVPVVSEKYQKTADLEAHFEQIRRKLNERRNALKDKIDRTGRSLQEELKPGTDAYRERRKQLALLEAELQWFIESEGRQADQGLAELLKEIYADILTAVREVARESGIDVVLAADKLPESPPNSAVHVRQQILLQKVLYWNPGLDITDQVVTWLNAKYGLERAKRDNDVAPPREPHDSRNALQRPSTPAGAVPKIPER